MAQQRATIASHALDDARIDLTPARERRAPVEAPSEDRSAPSPDGSDLLGGFASLRPSGKRDRLVPYPIRLAQSQIDALEELRQRRGIIPAEFIRDAVASCLELLRKA